MSTPRPIIRAFGNTLDRVNANATNNKNLPKSQHGNGIRLAFFQGLERNAATLKAKQGTTLKGKRPGMGG